MKANQKEPYRFPTLAYYAVSLTHTLPWTWIGLSNAESRILSGRLADFKIQRPVYITGLARAGTTITLEMLSKHPDVATHRYIDYVQPFLPWSLNRLLSHFGPGAGPSIERAHKDGIRITRESPKSVEEIFWMKFFKDLHLEEKSNILSRLSSNPGFETFYQLHLKKMLSSRKRTRYVTKANYNITRMRYLLRLFPDARFIVMVRNPLNQVASLVKQDRIITGLVDRHPRLGKFLQMIGHFEFGRNRRCINTANPEVIAEIRRRWKAGQSAQGWALYWRSIYEFIADAIETHSDLAKACLIVRYEDLCHYSSRTIDEILKHCGLSAKPFAYFRAEYARKLHAPTYYRPDFTTRELHDIAEDTGTTAARFGYEEQKSVRQSFDKIAALAEAAGAR